MKPKQTMIRRNLLRLNKTYVYQSTSNDVFFNMAFEEFLWNNHLQLHSKPCNILYLWQNEPCIILGRFQNPYEEIYHTKVPKKAKEVDSLSSSSSDIQLVRRKSGGGTVYQDLGNSVYTFITTSNNNSLNIDEIKEHNNEMIRNSLIHFGIDGSLIKPSGRNDIHYQNKKISGSAFQSTTNSFLHHGTLLIDLNINKMKEYLNPDVLKIQSKSIKSVASRVININDILKATNQNMINHQLWSQSLITQFKQHHHQQQQQNHQLKVNVVDKSKYLKNHEINVIYQQLKSNQWRYGKIPQFTQQIKKKFSWGLIEILLNVQKGAEYIDEITIYSDMLYPSLLEQINHKFDQNLLTYNSNSLIDLIQQISVTNDDQIQIISDICQLLKSQMR